MNKNNSIFKIELGTVLLLTLNIIFKAVDVIYTVFFATSINPDHFLIWLAFPIMKVAVMLSGVAIFVVPLLNIAALVFIIVMGQKIKKEKRSVRILNGILIAELSIEIAFWGLIILVLSGVIRSV